MKGPVVLLGPPGAGKSTAGRIAAERLGMAFVDLDDEVGDVAAIFTNEGEISFRVRELRALDRALDGRNVIVAAGAGIVDTHDGRELLQARALSVCIHANDVTACGRVQAQGRPWLPEGNGALAVYRVREQARPPHRAALTALDVNGNGTVEDTAAALVAVVSELRPASLVALPPSVCFERLEMARVPPHAVVVVEETVARLHGIAGHVVVPGGEEHKRIVDVDRLASELSKRGTGRSSLIIAVGGGAFLDVVGLTAALFHRGVPWWAVPTTLLAQADAGFGGKTAVNAAHRKNQLGVVHAPDRTVIDERFLLTLSDAQLREGRTEMLKHEMLAADAPEDGSERSPRNDLGSLRSVERSLAIKASIVARDPLEHGLRAVLNLGHTLAHALEASPRMRSAGPATALSHGEAVRQGLLAMLHLSASCAGLDAGAARTLADRVRALGPPARLDVDGDQVRKAIGADKKGGAWVLLRKPGLPVMVRPPLAAVEEALSFAGVPPSLG